MCSLPNHQEQKVKAKNGVELPQYLGRNSAVLPCLLGHPADRRQRRRLIPFITSQQT
jgi:hypothetical protein